MMANITCPLLIGSERKREPAIVDPTPDLTPGKVVKMHQVQNGPKRGEIVGPPFPHTLL